MNDPNDTVDRETLTEADRRSTSNTRQSYERIPYETNPWASSQPARLETIAKLYGLEAAPADACRMLELGCGDGGNLIPLAIAHPSSHFVGLDLASPHIETATAFASELALENTEFTLASFVDFGREQAPFDYIVAHGLMSWITPQLQDVLLATCKKLLAPEGITFVSYNTYPGWAMQHTIRELLRRHNEGVSDIDEALTRSRALLDGLARVVPGHESAYRDYIVSVGAVARDPAKRYYFAHEYLEDENHPFYVRDFIRRAASNGLGYIGDADLVDSELDNMPEEQRGVLEGLADDSIDRIQILDLAVNRKFRQSLLCHVDQPLRKLPDWERIREMYVSSALIPGNGQGNVATTQEMQFSDRSGRTIELDQPLAKASLIHFIESSAQPIAFSDLMEWAFHRIGIRPAPDATEESEKSRLVAIIFGRLFMAGMLEVQASPPAWALVPSDHPTASPLARHAATHGGRTTSLRHRTIALDNEAVCSVIVLLDGTRDRAALIRALDGRLDGGEIDKILELAAKNALLSS